MPAVGEEAVLNSLMHRNQVETLGAAFVCRFDRAVWPAVCQSDWKRRLQAREVGAKDDAAGRGEAVCHERIDAPPA
jgi:hypothetical protein